ncbi:hypothetical protein [Flavobacterium weaverense]|uniref:Uncharacterized protein n=1 Tax=Flavobacterium weaverense TaxID=271156 RepID=A0A3L9ZX46_9FLAO|nr:hypothetical protein [Flavobacterium weaverense]RMA76990.1 hypothetical protein BC961_0971 [Flavobacterium weaverense]
MKVKIFFLCVFLFATSVIFSQNKNAPRSIISSTAVIKKYHGLEELKKMKKGDLLELYAERVQVLIKTIPYMALATKSGATLTDLGVPNNSVIKKVLETQDKATEEYLKISSNFQKKILPYTDKDVLISSILYYESTMKSFHEYNDL